jgi:hypothetical protein
MRDSMRFVRTGGRSGLPSNGLEHEPEVVEVLGISREGLKVLAANKLANARQNGEVPYPWWVRRWALLRWYLEYFTRRRRQARRIIREEGPL